MVNRCQEKKQLLAERAKNQLLSAIQIYLLFFRYIETKIGANFVKIVSEKWQRKLNSRWWR